MKTSWLPNNVVKSRGFISQRVLYKTIISLYGTAYIINNRLLTPEMGE